MKINLEFANEFYRIPTKCMLSTMMHHLFTRAVSTLCAIIIRDNRQMDTGGYRVRVISSDINHCPARGRWLRVSTLLVSTRGIYKVSPCDNHKMDNGIQSGCLYLDFRSLGVKVTEL